MSTTGGDLRARPTLKSEAAGPQESPGHRHISSEEASGLRPAEMDVSLSQKVMLWWGGGGGEPVWFSIPQLYRPFYGLELNGSTTQFALYCSALTAMMSHN